MGALTRMHAHTHAHMHAHTQTDVSAVHTYRIWATATVMEPIDCRGNDAASGSARAMLLRRRLCSTYVPLAEETR